MFEMQVVVGLTANHFTGPPEYMEPWSHGSTILYDLTCQFQNCKLEVCTTNSLKVMGVLPSPPYSKPFQRACGIVGKKFYFLNSTISHIEIIEIIIPTVHHLYRNVIITIMIDFEANNSN